MLHHVQSSRVGLSGASKISDRNPRALILKTIEDNPGIEKEAAFELFILAVGTDRGYWRAMAFYYFLHMWDYAFGPTTRTKPDPIQQLEARLRESERVESIKQEIVMLDLTMTNGKLLGDCTGAELMTMNSKFKKLAERVGKSKTVRSVLNEDQVKAIMK